MLLDLPGDLEVALIDKSSPDNWLVLNKPRNYLQLKPTIPYDQVTAENNT